jgi:hypothetical protein
MISDTGFSLADPKRRTFRAERMCWPDSIDDWIDVEPHGSIENVAQALVLKLGADASFELR